MAGIYKTKYNLNPNFMKQIFEEKEMPYNLRCSDKLQLQKAKKPALETILSDLWAKGMGDNSSRAENSDSFRFSKGLSKTISAMPATADYVKHFIQR